MSRLLPCSRFCVSTRLPISLEKPFSSTFITKSCSLLSKPCSSSSSSNGSSSSSHVPTRIKYIDPPNSDWVAPQKISSPVNEMVTYDASKLKGSKLYEILIGGVLPRPIGFVSTISSNGAVNLAPFSFFNGVSSSPPCVILSLTKTAQGGKKDTLINIEETKEFVVNTAAKWMSQPLNWCSANFPYGVSEMEKAGLTPIPSLKIKPPRCKEAPIQFECTLFNTMEVGEGLGSSTLVVGKVVAVHIAKEAIVSETPDGKHITLDPEFLQPLSRLGGASYGLLGEIFDIGRPKI
eukprot:TRINITY_DN2635_c0_g1_i1.p1 TRINITY_DN2635_c0_g1~~TRINITY_DN2635_c0_g1_i1.p1  ORF type:complete len:292 (-),score=42.47 TRINITY_DN2635_c0_g1_i1:18-893(-)